MHLLSAIFSLLPLAIIAWVIWQWREPRILLKPEPRFEDEGEAYDFFEQEQKDKLVALWFAFKVPAHLSFELRREGGFDRFAKKLGLTNEVQFNDERFDSRYFVDTDDLAFVRALRARELWRDNLKDLFTRLQANGASFMRIDCEDGWLRLRAAAKSVVVTDGVRRSVVRCLKPFLVSLREFRASAEGEHVKLIRRKRNVRRVAYATLFFGVAAGLALYFFSSVHLVDGWKFLRLSLWIAAIPTLLFLVWGHSRVSMSANRHRLAVEALLVAVPGIAIATMVAVRGININADFSRAERIVATDASVRVVYKRRSPTQYRISYQVNDPRVGDYDRSMTISPAKYEQLIARWGGDKSSEVGLLVRRGALGLDWVTLE